MPKKKVKKKSVKKSRVNRIKQIMHKKSTKKPAKKLLKKQIKKVEHITVLKSVATKLFGNLIDTKCMKYFSRMKTTYDSADMDMMFRTYLCVMFLVSIMSYFSALLFTLITLIILKPPIMFFLMGILFLPIIIGSGVFAYMYSYPSVKASQRRASIESNMPFAINHMAAVSESGATPYTMFKVLAQFKEYGVISEESEKMVRNVDLFGLDIISALRQIISETPSKEFKEFLEGLLTTIQTGGSLTKYLKEEAKETMLTYRITREKYTQMISIYADFYTALLIAAPLVLIAILSILSMVGGSVFGLPVDLTIKLGIYVLIPLLNVLFLAFLSMTQPAM